MFIFYGINAMVANLTIRNIFSKVFISILYFGGHYFGFISFTMSNNLFGCFQIADPHPPNTMNS